MAELQPSDLKGMADHELAYLVIAQLATATAVLANLFSRGKRYKPAEFMIQLRPRAESSSDAMRMVREWAADLPTVVQAKVKELEGG